MDANGVLNLDGQNPVENGRPRKYNYAVTSKFGSLVMLGIGNDYSTTKAYDSSKHVAWLPGGYTLPSGTGQPGWNSIPYQDSSTTTDNPALGLGDPCTYAMKDGVVGDYVMPTTLPNMISPYVWDPILGDVYNSADGTFVLNRFLPMINSSGTYVMADNGAAWYWTNLHDPNNQIMAYSSKVAGVSTNTTAYYTNTRQGLSIRCVHK